MLRQGRPDPFIIQRLRPGQAQRSITYRVSVFLLSEGLPCAQAGEPFVMWLSEVLEWLTYVPMMTH